MATFINHALATSIFIACITVVLFDTKQLATHPITLLAACASLALSILNTCVNTTDPLRWLMIIATGFFLLVIIAARAQ